MTTTDSPASAPEAAPARPSREPAPPPRRSVRGSLMLLAADTLGRLPEAPLVAVAEALGELWYRLAPGRAAQARANLRRVCEGLADTGRGTARARRAATDPDALERLVRAAFRHAVRYYLEVARTGSFDLAMALAKIDVETPAEVEAALQRGHPIVLVGMHFGAIELPAVEVAHLVGHRVTGPMETVQDPVVQRWFIETRSRVNVDIIPVVDMRRPLLQALRRGESVGLIADRDVIGNGIRVPFFGHPAPFPAGPALLSLEAGVPLYVGGARRTKGLRYAGKVVLVPAPESGTRRERLTALTAAMARAFETILADAPEQWWGAFHPIWPDLAVGEPAAPTASGRRDGTGPRDAEPAAPTASSRREGTGPGGGS